MTLATETCYMQAERIAELVASNVRDLKPAIEWADDRRPFMIRDSFDQSLRGSQRLLLEDGDHTELLSASGAALRQDATPQARFVTEFADGPVKEALADLSPLRALLPVASGTVRSGRLVLVDDEGKTHARLAA